MRWKKDERVRFVGRLLDGEGMSDVCRDFEEGRLQDSLPDRQKRLEAPTDRSRRPVSHANQLPWQIKRLIVESKRDKPHWAALN